MVIDVKVLLGKINNWILSKDYKGYGSSVNLASYTSSSNTYTVPRDGVVILNCTYRSGSYLMLYADGILVGEQSTPAAYNAQGNNVVTVPVVKGQKLYVTISSAYSTAVFRPYNVGGTA